MDIEELKEKIRTFNAKEVLVEMKDLSGSMLDLAYSAVLYSNPEIAKEVFRLEEMMHSLLYRLRIAIMLGARNLENAVEFAGILQIASAAEKIANAAGDIAKIGMSVDITSYLDREDFEEAVINVRIKPSSVFKDKSLESLKLETETGMRVLAIKRGSEWIYSPDKNERLREGDLVITSGPTEGIPMLCKMATGRDYQEREVEREAGVNIKRLTEKIADLIADMKNISELMVGLSYSAVTLYNHEIANEVKDLEESMDRMKEELEILVMEAARGVTEKSNFNELRGLLHIAVSSEIISDAAYEIADVVLRDIPLHPVFLASIEESDEIILKMEVKNEEIVSKTLKELKIETRTGMFILAIRRKEGKWIYNPGDDAELRKGDLLIMRGPREGEGKMREICGDFKDATY
ncbi:MAG: potassium channel protein [Methanophagales archaeon ANME-1-THS]|nr:MAG: potassium channel protein [Methanophagales archaeon ANME-1-THS]